MKRKNKEVSKKDIAVELAGKVMVTVFWDSKGELLIDYLPHGTMITAARYCDVLKKLRWAVQNKRSCKLTKPEFLFMKTLVHTLLL